MVERVTKGIKITVNTKFEGIFIKNNKETFAFSYAIQIENHSNEIVQLRSRYWRISDALNTTTYVKGEGVIGKKPIIKPQENYTYSFGSLLLSPFGSMKGHFSMISLSTTKIFRVIVPRFQMSSPFALN